MALDWELRLVESLGWVLVNHSASHGCSAGTWSASLPRRLDRWGLGRSLRHTGLLGRVSGRPLHLVVLLDTGLIGKWAKKRSWKYFGYPIPKYSTAALEPSCNSLSCVEASCNSFMYPIPVGHLEETGIVYLEEFASERAPRYRAWGRAWQGLIGEQTYQRETTRVDPSSSSRPTHHKWLTALTAPSTEPQRRRRFASYSWPTSPSDHRALMTYEPFGLRCIYGPRAPDLRRT
jgi:hypothetical protein